MFGINDNFCNLEESYLFSQVAQRILAFQQSHPDVQVIRMGIGDVTRPLCPAVIHALHCAVNEQASADTFRGYGPEQGYSFLREAIAENDYRARGINISPDEIFVSDGAKSDTGNILDILSPDNSVALTDPVYPVYFDTNVMCGRKHIVKLECTEANGFVPDLPDERVDIIYLCFPNNPTGASISRQRLALWVDYALRNGSLLLFDSAYEAYITDPDVPHSIYEIEGARRVAVEFRSFSKTAGFTGLRCAYTVVPHDLVGADRNGRPVDLHRLWLRRQSTKFNGASYLSQRAAEAIYTPEGASQVRETVDYYLRNARTLLDGAEKAGLKAYGGVNSPYVWIKTPSQMSSWGFFDLLLDRCNIACTPGSGFGRAGEGFIRLTAFNTAEMSELAARRLMEL